MSLLNLPPESRQEDIVWTTAYVKALKDIEPEAAELLAMDALNRFRANCYPLVDDDDDEILDEDQYAPDAAVSREHNLILATEVIPMANGLAFGLGRLVRHAVRAELQQCLEAMSRHQSESIESDPHVDHPLNS